MTGDGTEASPYVVTSVADFMQLDGKGGYAVLANDIDFAPAGLGDSYTSISTAGESGGGLIFDGQGHSIKNFYQKTSGNGGLFSSFYGTFKNCKIVDAYILATGSGNVGILTSSFVTTYNTVTHTVSDVTITGLINATGSANVGGMAGTMTHLVTLTNCKVVVNINATSNRAGGFVGDSGYKSNYHYLTFKNCISACRINGGIYVGGYIGFASTNGKFTFDECISQCDLRGAHYHYGYCNYSSAYYTNCASICSMKNATTAAYGYGESLGKTIQSYSKCVFDNCSQVYGICGRGTLVQSYSACSMKNMPEDAAAYGLGSSCTIDISYYDADIFTATEGGDDGAVSTTELKSADWLREQGWAI